MGTMKREERVRVAILGAGRIGSAVEAMLRRNGAAVSLWDAKKGLVRDQKPIEDVVSGAGYVFLCIPSWAYRDALKRIKRYLPERAVIVSFAKGIEPGMRTTVDVAVRKAFPKNPLCVFGGPMLAEEIERSALGAGVVASVQENASKRVIGLFTGTSLILESSTDVFGTAIAGVMKNAYSLAFGIAEGIGWNDNARGWLFASAAREMVRGGALLGARKETLEGLAGIGDFAACVLSPHSRHHRSGIELSKRGTCSIRCEGIASVPFLGRMLRKRRREFPILFALASIVTRKKNPRKAFGELIASAQRAAR